MAGATGAASGTAGVSESAADPERGSEPDAGAGLGADPEGSDPRQAAEGAADLARAILAALPASAENERAAVVQLVHQAESASATHARELAGRAVQALVDLRSVSRAAGDWAASDRLRDVLAGVGVEVRDSREGSMWQWI